LHVAFDGRHLTAAVPRGMDRYTLGLIRGLTARGIEVTLFARAKEPLNRALLTGSSARLRELPDRSAVHWEQIAVPLALRRDGCDLYHAPAERGVPLAAPCPVVFTIHSVTHRSYADLVRRGLLAGPASRYVEPAPRSLPSLVAGVLGPLQIRRANHILAPSAYARHEIIHLLGVPSSKVTATPLAVDALFLRPPHPAGERGALLRRLGVAPPYLLYVGGYEPHKNVDGLLACFGQVRASRPDLRLVLVGSQPAPDALLQRARQQGLAAPQAVCFLAGLTDELPDLYDGAEAFVSLSWRETFGLPCLEAMTRGLPVVASRWGAGTEVVGEGGVCVDPREPAAAARAVLDLLGGDRAAWRGRALRQAARFGWDGLVATTLRCYEACLAPASRAAEPRGRRG